MNNPFASTPILPGLGAGVARAIDGNFTNIVSAFDSIIDESETLFRASVRDSVITGYTTTVDEGLYIFIATGEAIVFGVRVINDSQDRYLLTATKNNFIDLSSDGAITITAVTIGDAEPAIAADNIRIAMVVTNATIITKIYDKREYSGTSNPIKNTPEGGLAVLITAGETILRGEVLCLATTGADDVYNLAPTSADNPTGVAYGDIAAGCKGWMVVSGKAYVLPIATRQMAKGDHVYMSTVTAGRADSQATVNTVRHWGEIGHCCSTTAGAGIAGLCILHFN